MPKDAIDRLCVEPERAEDAGAAMALVDRVFGPGRYAKSAERLRESNRFLPDLSFVAREEGVIVGSVRLWPVRAEGRSALLLGPIAVEAGARSRGLGAALVERACLAAARAGHEIVILVGDVAYFEKLGFQVLAAPGVSLPGPADPRRILARGLRPGALEGLQGKVTLPSRPHPT